MYWNKVKDVILSFCLWASLALSLRAQEAEIPGFCQGTKTLTWSYGRRPGHDLNASCPGQLGNSQSASKIFQVCVMFFL